MLAGLDVETLRKNPTTGEWEGILDASGSNFTLACLVKETGGTKTWHEQKAVWADIIALGEKEFARDRKLTIYCHNSRYDVYNIINWEDKNFRLFCEHPFIAGYYKKIEKTFDTPEKFNSWRRWAKMNGQYFKIEAQILGVTTISYNKEIIKFLDTMALYHMSLKKLGKLVGHEKTEMPMEIGKKLTKGKLKELEKYCINDCRVTLEGVKYMREKLKNDGLNIRNLCTINQVAISYLIKELRDGNNEHILVKNGIGELTESTWKTYFPKQIHQAYRGGYVRVWKTGHLKDITQLDANSLYPYSAMNMKFPDLRTETLIKEPLKRYTLKEAVSKIGISKCMIHNKSDDLGLLLLRMDAKSYVFKKGKYAIGVWTNVELEEAIKNGYEILDIEWSINFEEGTNPFKDIFSKIYKKRKASEEPFNNYFYKMIMNAGIGKFGQTRVNQEILVDSIDKVYEYLNKGYKMLADIENSPNVVYINREVDKTVKKYYAPIIPTLITANSRIFMYRAFQKVPLDKLVYTDTDSIIAQGNFFNKFKLGKEIGQFKIEKDVETEEPLVRTDAIIWGTKAKRVGNNMGVSGVFKSSLNKEDFEKGEVHSTRMMGIKNTRNKKIGEFVVEERSLKKQLEEFKKSEDLLDSQMLYIDKGTKDITYFTKEIQKLDVIHLH